MIALLAETRKDELARIYQLGRLQEEYQVTDDAVVAGIVLLVLGIGGFLLSCVIAALNGSFASSVLASLIPFGILSAIGALVYCLGKRWVTRRRNWRIYLYEHGLIYHGQDLYPMHWNSVQSIIHKIVEHTSTHTTTDSDGHTSRSTSTSYTHHYEIYCKDGTELAARGVIATGTFVKGSELIKTIEQRSAPYLLGEAIRLLKSTGQAPFGALTVSQQGLLVKGNFLPWQELKSFSIGGTAVVFRKKGKWLAWQFCELGDVVNYEVFEQLVNMLCVN